MKEEIGNALIFLGIAMLLIGVGSLVYAAWFAEYGPGRIERELNYGNPGPMLAEVANTFVPLGFILIPTSLIVVYVGERIKETARKSQLKSLLRNSP